MANAANTRNVRNSKSRQYAQDRNKFGGSSAPSETASEKSSLRYGLKDMPKKDVPAEKSSLRYGLKDMPKKDVPAEKSSLRYGLKDMPKKDVPAEKSSLRYGLKDMPKNTSSTAAVKDKMVSGLEKAAKKVPAYEAIKGIPTSKVATGLGRAAMLEAGPAIAATVLAESADKYGRERGFGLQPRDVPKSSMSKKSDPIVDAINAEPKAKAATAVASKSEGTSPRTDYKPLKDMVSVKETPAVSKPALKSGTSKPKGPTEGDRARNSMADDWNAFSKGREADTAALKDITDRYKRTGTLVNSDAEDENARTKTEATENMKKGGMTKRPPKPAKKVPARKFASGGNVSRTSASKRGDGCATKGHTKGKYL
jgi:hypothetical protein